MTNANRNRLAILSLCLTAALVAAQPTRAESDNHVHGGGTQRVPGTDMDQNGRPMPPLNTVHVYAPSTYGPQQYGPQPVEPAPVYAPPPVAVPYPGAVAPSPMLSERHIEHLLQRQGFNRVRDVGYHNGQYVARARDGYGRPVQIVGLAHTGQILNVQYR